MKNIETFYPLSPLQKGLLFHVIFAPESPLYFQQMSCTIDGGLNVAAWKKAWQQAVDRHSILRTSFLWEGLKEPVQVVQQRVELPLEEQDWQPHSTPEQRRRLDAFLLADRSRGFDIAHPPLMRLALLRRRPDSYYFVWSHHHLLLDGWSVQLLLKDVFELYEAAKSGRQLALDAPRPYRDFIAWLKRQDLERAESFWREALRGFAVPTPLGVAHRETRRAGAALGGGQLSEQAAERAEITAEETARLQEFARRERVTLNTIMQGAWGLLLSRYSRERDVVFGAIVSGRPADLEGVEQMLGLFINTLPVRLLVNEEDEVGAWLRRIQEQQVEARQYEYAPLSEVQRWSEVERGQSLFESLFIFKNYPTNNASEEHNTGLDISSVQSYERTNYPLCFVLSAGEMLEIEMVYDCQRFDREAILQMIEYFQRLLTEMAADAHLRLKDLGTKSVEGYRLSPHQEQVWTAQQSLTHGTALPPRSVCSLSLHGPLDSGLLLYSFRLLASCNDILRTSFRTVPGIKFPLQLISPDSPLRLHEQDLRACDEANRGAAVEALLAQVARDESPPGGVALELHLLRLTDDEHLLVVSLPLLCADRRTWYNLAGEVAAAYEALRAGSEPAAADEGLPYVVFAEWQHQLLASEEMAEGRRFWGEQDYSGWTAARLPFTGIGAAGRVAGNGHLPSAFANQKHETQDSSTQSLFRPACLTRQLSRTVTDHLTTLAAQHQTSRAVPLLATWQTLLWRLGAPAQFILGLGFDGRTDQELERSLGVFSRTLPLVCRLSTGMRWDQLVAQVDVAVREAARWQECFSWADVSNSLDGISGGVDRAAVLGEGPGAGPLPVCFAYEAEAPETVAGDLRISVRSIEACMELFEVKLVCVERDARLLAQFHYDASRVEVAQIERLASQFCTLLEGAVMQPSATLERLEIVSARERQKLLAEWNNTSADYPRDVCLHELFEQQVEQTPEHVAVIAGDQQVTYGELNAKSNQLAAHLRLRGVGPEVLVGILMQRSIDMVIGMLAVLKAGAAYVPLDVSYPAERLRFMLEDAGTSLLLTYGESEESARVVAGSTMQVIYLEDEREQLAAQRTTNEPSRAEVENLAYVIYTSGSTGRPKGVMITHRAITNHMHWMKESFPLGADDAVLQKTPVSFDASVWEFYAPLISGAKLVMAEGGGHLDPEYLLRVIREKGVSVLQVVPTMLRMLVEQGGLDQCRSLRRVYSGGEVLPAELAKRFSEQAEWVKLFNLYGPTEASIDATWWEYRRGGREEVSVAIGMPIGNMRAYVLDPWMRLTAVGGTGELYLGGPGVGRGYLKRADLTAERYLPDPYSREAGGRLYRTGDLVFYRECGEIQYAGRADGQVKVRGYRIELSEIEAAVRELEGVSEVVVEVREGDEGAGRLVAYIVTKAGADKRLEREVIEEVRRHLNQKLPDYMVPAHFILLYELPLTSSGKIDRQALPAPERTRQELTRDYVAPRNPVEETLAAIWGAVLGVEKVGIHDNFFELGGDSILSFQVSARSRQAGMSLTLKQLFDNPTIAQLSTVVGTASTGQFEQGAVTGPVPLTPIQHLFFEQGLPDPAHYNQATLLGVRKKLDAGLLAQAVKHLLSHHDALRLRFVRGGARVQQFNAGDEKNEIFSLIDLSDLAEEEQRPAIEASADQLQRSLNLEVGPLIRVVLFNLGAGRPDRLLIIIHHLAVDGVSWRILLDDLYTVYDQLTRGETVQLPAKTTSFKQWAEHLHEYARSGAVLQETAYWLANARGDVKRLPLDFSDGVNTEASARTVSISLNQEETRSLLQEVPAAYHTQINDVLLTGLTQTFLNWTGDPGLLLDMEGHGREELTENIDLSRTVGWFTAVCPVLLQLEKTSDPGQALKSIKEQLRQVPNRGIGYGLLRYLSGKAELEALWAFQPAEVCFNYLGQWDQASAKDSPFVTARESSGPARGEQGLRSYLLDISGGVCDGQLQMNWTYSKDIHRRTTVEGLALTFMEALRALIAHCKSPEAGGFTPSDFPAANLSQSELDNFIASLG